MVPGILKKFLLIRTQNENWNIVNNLSHAGPDPLPTLIRYAGEGKQYYNDLFTAPQKRALQLSNSKCLWLISFLNYLTSLYFEMPLLKENILSTLLID